MKFTLAIAASFLFLVSCNDKKKETNDNESTSTDTTTTAPIVGNDKDEHGCEKTAGFKWSELKNKCIQPFKEGTQFEENDPEKGKSTEAAYVVVSDDKSKAEVFWSKTEKSIILNKVKLVEGETEPIIFENKSEKIDIKNVKNQYLINFDGKSIYFSEYSEKDGFNTKYNHTFE